MITPRLIRRSLAHGFQWRLLLLWVVAMLVPTVIAMLPVSGFLGQMLDQWPRAKEVVASIDGATLVELLRQLGENGARTAIGGGLIAASLVLLLIAPALAGAALAVARSDEPLRFTALLRGAGESYGKMLRLGALVALIPLGLAAIPAGIAFKLSSKASEKAVLESQAERGLRLALIVAAVAYFLAQLTLDAARAHLAAQPERRSAFLAWWNGVKLLFRQPLKTLGLGAATSIVGLGLAAFLMVLRLRVVQGGVGGVLLAFALAQLSVAAVGWYRASRIVGLAELVRADALDRDRRFEMQPPVTSPPSRRPAPAGPVAMPLPLDTGLPMSEHVEAFPEQIEQALAPAVAPPEPVATLPEVAAVPS